MFSYVFFCKFYIFIFHLLFSQSSHVCVWLFAIPWTTACQASLSFTISQSLLNLMSFESVMPCNQRSTIHVVQFSSVQFSSVTQSCPTLCDPMNCSMPGLLFHHQLPEFIQTHVHRVGDAIQPSHPAPNPSQHQSLFQWILRWYSLI